MKYLFFIGIFIVASLGLKAQSYTWTNSTNHKITVNFGYDMPVGSGVLISKEFNPGESFTFNALPGHTTRAVLTGGRWNAQFGTLFMGTLVGCNRPGHYDIR